MTDPQELSRRLRGELVILASNPGNIEGAPSWIKAGRDRGDHGFWTCAAAIETSPKFIRADKVADALDLIDAQAARIAELEKAIDLKDTLILDLQAALEPFAAIGELMTDDDGWSYAEELSIEADPNYGSFAKLKSGDFRSARHVLDAIHAKPRTQEQATSPASDAMGRWMSAALDDPGVCAEMKADINAWFAAGQPLPEPSEDFDAVAARAWDFVRPKLVSLNAEKGLSGVWSNGFRSGWAYAASTHSARKALSNE